MKNDKTHGSYKEFYPNGQLKWEFEFENGQLKRFCESHSI